MQRYCTVISYINTVLQTLQAFLLQVSNNSVEAISNLDTQKHLTAFQYNEQQKIQFQTQKWRKNE